MTDPFDPINHVPYERDSEDMTGLTKREYFAARAMQGLLANPDVVNNERRPGTLAGHAVDAADALIKELNR